MVRAPAMTRLLLLIALIAAVGLRALTPQGWMPDPRGRSGGVLVICTGEGERTVPDPAGHVPAHGKPRHEPCAFAGLHAAPTPDPTFPPGPSPSLRVESGPVPHGLAPPKPDWRRPQAARAPPLQA